MSSKKPKREKHACKYIRMRGEDAGKQCTHMIFKEIPFCKSHMGDRYKKGRELSLKQENIIQKSLNKVQEIPSDIEPESNEVQDEREEEVEKEENTPDDLVIENEENLTLSKDLDFLHDKAIIEENKENQPKSKKAPSKITPPKKPQPKKEKLDLVPKSKKIIDDDLSDKESEPSNDSVSDVTEEDQETLPVRKKSTTIGDLFAKAALHCTDVIEVVALKNKINISGFSRDCHDCPELKEAIEELANEYIDTAMEEATPTQKVITLLGMIAVKNFSINSVLNQSVQPPSQEKIMDLNNKYKDLDDIKIEETPANKMSSTGPNPLVAEEPKK